MRTPNDGDRHRNRHQAPLKRVRRVRLVVGVNHRLEPVRELAAAEDAGQADEAGEDRADRQDHQRHRHHRRRFVQVLLGVMIGAALAVESHEHLAEHVERRHARAAQSQEPNELVAVLTGEGLPEDLVLGEEAGERRKAGDGEHGDEERPNVNGIHCLSPPILRMSCSWCMAWITLPAPRKRQALKNAWVIRWKIAAA